MAGSFFAKTTQLAAATAVATFLAASRASALSLTFDGWTNSYKGVTLTKPGTTGQTQSVAAGAFNMKETSTLDRFTVFCLDLLAVIQSGRTYGYEVTDTPFDNGGSYFPGLIDIDRIQKIFDSSYDTALASNVASAGFQVALWNGVYDDDWSVANDGTGGTFYQTGGNTSALDEANRVLLVAMDYNGAKKYNLSFFESTEVNPRSQNLVTAAPVPPGGGLPPVPLPATGLMLLTALGGLFVGRRRKAA